LLENKIRKLNKFKVVDEVDDDMIIAEKVKETPKPQFFPPKEEPKPVEEETKPEPVQQSVTP